jgi:hypothetical protein
MADNAKTVRLWQELALALAFKGFLLAILWALFFSAPEDVNLDDQKVASRVLSPQPEKEHNHDAVPRTR